MPDRQTSSVPPPRTILDVSGDTRPEICTRCGSGRVIASCGQCGKPRKLPVPVIVEVRVPVVEYVDRPVEVVVEKEVRVEGPVYTPYDPALPLPMYAAMEHDYTSELMRRCGGNCQDAAKMSGLGKTTIYRMKHNLEQSRKMQAMDVLRSPDVPDGWALVDVMRLVDGLSGEQR